ncbi:hypothetical protein CDD83_4143 [Cordyceps sp. RAO-2017]|nr:hypothetical protein CDD83_4143 [Cordyceps sp. RAO-2017]
MRTILFFGFLAPIVTGTLNRQQGDAKKNDDNNFQFPACEGIPCYDALDDYIPQFDNGTFNKVCKDFSETNDSDSIDKQAVQERCKTDPLEKLVWEDIKEACECVQNQA